MLRIKDEACRNFTRFCMFSSNFFQMFPIFFADTLTGYIFKSLKYIIFFLYMCPFQDRREKRPRQDKLHSDHTHIKPALQEEKKSLSFTDKLWCLSHSEVLKNAQKETIAFIFRPFCEGNLALHGTLVQKPRKHV